MNFKYDRHKVYSVTIDSSISFGVWTWISDFAGSGGLVSHLVSCTATVSVGEWVWVHAVHSHTGQCVCRHLFFSLIEVLIRQKFLLGWYFLCLG